MKQIIFLFLFIFFFKSNAQVFSYSSANSQTLTDVPGGTMLWNVTFSNPSALPINVQFERYQKYNPPYWFSCFCYVQCNPPSMDAITISLAAFSSSMLTVLFKTDSVNPGTATSSIRIYEAGFANNADTVHLSASTLLPTSITQINSGTLLTAYPNPVTDKIIISPALNEYYSLTLLDINGKIIKYIADLNDKKHSLNMESYSQGTYFIKITYRSTKTETQTIIKN